MSWSSTITMNQLPVHEDSAAALAAANRFEAAVQRLDRLAADVTRLLLAPPPHARFRYRPGQYLSLILADGQRRSFSMANAWGVDRPIELHIRRRLGGVFSETALGSLKVGDNLTFEGPFGQVEWREGRGPAILMGTGTGLAPLKALLEHALAAGSERPIRLYWGGRAPSDLYLDAHLSQLARRHTRFSFIPVLSRPPASWAGRRGYVQDAVAEDFDDLHHADLYACGSGAMIDAARAQLGQLPGFHEDRFLTDAFEPAAPVVRSSGLPAVQLFVNLHGDIRSVRGPLGATLLSALREADAPILSVCGGKASCGTCKITVAEPWRDRLPQPARTERRLLANLDDIGPADRLACQIPLTQETDGLAVSLVCHATAKWPA
jgi:CDP-4-dehydro-6-deoxyglucose reductase